MLRSKNAAAPLPLGFSLPAQYGVVTLHRPVNVDDPQALGELVSALTHLSASLALVFPVHPRTYASLQRFNLLPALEKAPAIFLTEPLSYIPFMHLVQRAHLVITDSGGIQEETTYLGIPCLTVRTTTERPITISQGSNRLVRTAELPQAVAAALRNPGQRRPCPEFWDGHTAERVAQSLKEKALLL